MKKAADKPAFTPRKYTPQIVLEELKRLATKATLDGMARYSIPSEKALGVKVSDMQKLAKKIGPNHELAIALWKTDCYEARMMAAYLDEPERVTPTQMDQWCNDFDNWAIVDTVCFCLFDRTKHALNKIKQWSRLKGEFQKRAAFALLWSYSLHDKKQEDGVFLECLPLLERAANDERNFVKKAVVMGLRAVGERSTVLNDAAVDLAARLATSTDQTERWVGKESLKKLKSPATIKRLSRRR